MWRLYVTLLVLIAGCASSPKAVTSRVLDQTLTQETSNSCSPLLGLLGGLCCIGGMILLVITQGRIGWRPIVGGIVFILINYALAIYGHWFFIPAAIMTGIIGLAWTVKIVVKILKNKELKELQLWN